MPLVALIALCCAPAWGIAQSILGSAGNFTILGGAAVTSTGVAGTTIIGGDVGSAAAVTGFPPAVVTGGGVITTDTSVVDPALADLTQVENGLAAMPFTLDESGLDLGGMTLLPGVYSFSSAAMMNGNLTLDANGENNAFWVFQIGSTLTTAANSTVTLIDPGSLGGIDDGIYWDTGTGITIGADNQILGNYLSGTSITLGSGSSGSGRAMAQAGVSLDANQINANGGPGGSGWTGGLMYNAGLSIVPIPEPIVLLWLAMLGCFGLVLWWCRSTAKIIA